MNLGQVGLGSSLPKSARPGQLGLYIVYIVYEILFDGTESCSFFLLFADFHFVSPLNEGF